MTSEVTTRAPDKIVGIDERRGLRRVELKPLAPREIDTLAEIHGAPSRRRPSFLRRHWMSILLLWIPIFAATIYFFFIASDIYISETKYIVRASSQSAGEGLGALMQSEGLTRGTDDTYAVNEYLLSRDAAAKLAEMVDLKALMSRNEGDIFSRYPGVFGKDDSEHFYRSYRRFIEISLDDGSGITTLQAYGFRPRDANVLAVALLKIGEQFINKLNSRAHEDALSFAKSLVSEAQSRVNSIEARIADYRNTQLIVDPQKESAAAITQLGVMATEVSRMEAALSQQSVLAPNSPSIAATRQRIRSYKDEMAKLQAKVVGGPNSMADKLRGFELLSLEQALAAKGLAAATLELEKARRDSETQRIYLQQITVPNTPDQPLLPHRFLYWLGTVMLTAAIFWLVRSFTSTTLDHQA